MNETPINNQKSRETSAPLGSVTDGRLRFMRGASNVTIHTDPSTSDLFRVRFEGPLPSVWVEGGDVAIEYPWTLHPFDWRKRGAGVVLAVRAYDRGRPRGRLDRTSRSDLTIFAAFGGQGLDA